MGRFRAQGKLQDYTDDERRSFPDISYFRLSATHDTMTDILFIFAKLTPEVGYRQGMHELLAPILWTVDYEIGRAHV